MTYSIFHSTKALQTFLEAIALLALSTAWLRSRWGGRLFLLAEQRFNRFSGSRWRSIAAAAIFPMLIRFLLLPVFPAPEPRVHDEFSYLLLADTFAHGRLANPTPPSWEHFETEYELIRPTYASQYEPAQGLMLAAGKVAAGSAWWGVWLSTGLMCAALCWALRFIVPPRWALFGSMIAALQFGIFGFWMNSYFGGAVPAIGGALVFGSLARRRDVSGAILGAIGILIVLASRPVEGVIWLCAALAVTASRGASKRYILAFTMIFAAGLCALGYYNSRVTGNALEFPYALYRHDYGTPQSYWWQPPVVVSHFNHAELAANYSDQLSYWERRYSVAAMWDSTWHRARDFWRFFIGPFLTPALLFAAFALRRRRLRMWVWISGLFILDHATYHAWYPQQSAPETILIVLFIVEGWRQLRIWRARRRTGLTVSRHLVLGFAAASALICAGLVVIPALNNAPGGVRRIWDTMISQPDARETAIRRLENAPGKHLVFVRYGAGHPWYDEWVFNAADIPGARIVFARMCTPESDLALIQTMSDRDVWIASPDAAPLLARVAQPESLVATTEP